MPKPRKHYAVRFLEYDFAAQEPANKVTGKINVNIETKVFPCHMDQIKFVAENNDFEAVTVKHLRRLKLGLTRDEFDGFMEDLRA